jgi:hypothetical protein
MIDSNYAIDPEQNSCKSLQKILKSEVVPNANFDYNLCKSTYIVLI